MTKYLYVFSYQTPEQQVLSAEPGVPDESCQAVFIEADSKEEALAWGRQISEEFVRGLFGSQSVSWSEQNFPHGIESEPHLEYPQHVLEGLPAVRCGVHPDFQAIKV